MINLLAIASLRKFEILVSVCLYLLRFTPVTPLQLIVFPGILLYTKQTHTLFSLLEKTVLAGLISLAFWIVSFSFLKYLPISLTSFITIVQYFCIAWVIAKGFAYKKPFFQRGDWILLVGFLCIFIPYICLYSVFNGPVGNDMGIISYTATIITSVNKYPTTYFPLLPIDHFGFAPIGFSVISAMITLLSTIPIYKSLLLLSLLSYPIYWVSLYLYVSNFYSKYKSLLIVYIVFGIGQHIRGFFPWGGNITIWSITFLIMAIWLYIRLHQRGHSSIKYLLVIALLIAASFYTHQVAFLGFIFFVFAYALITLMTSPQRIILLQRIGLLAALIGLFLIPFISSTNLPSPETIAFVKNYLQTAPYYTMSSDISGLFTSIPEYISKEIGPHLMILWIAGVALAIFQTQTNDLWHFAAIPVYWLIVANTKLWFLPFSFGLYPDRILGLFSIIYAYFVGRALPDIADVRLLTKSTKIFLSLFMVICIPFVVSMQRAEYITVRNAGILQSSVTNNDMAAFQWIIQNTNNNDVIANNQGDAGIWIPVYTKRMVARSDSSPHIFDELFLAESKLRPTYAYIGDKVSYPTATPHTANDYNNPNYSLVFSQGNAKIYKVLTNANK